MRVLHFCPQFSPLSETFIYGYITEMERQGIDVHVVTFDRVNAKDRPFSKVHAVAYPWRWNVGQVWRRGFAMMRGRDRVECPWPTVRSRLRKIVDEVAPDICHAHFGGAGVILAPVAAETRIPLVVTFYGQDISGLPRDPQWRRRYAELWPRMAAATVLSTHMESKVRHLGCPAAKAHVVHLGCSIGAPPTRASGPVNRLLLVGRLVEKKGHISTIRAFGRARQRCPGLILDIVGDGPLRGQIEQSMQDCRVENGVRLHGERPNHEVLQMMTDADAFISCSLTASDGDEEGTPTVLVEAQAKGLPCISTFHAGIPEVIAPENHWLLAPEGDIPAIADRIETLVRQPPEALEQIVAAGWRHVSANFDLASESRKLVRLYEAVRKPVSSA